MIDNLKILFKETLKKNLKGYILLGSIFFAGVLLSFLLNISTSYEEEMKLYINDFVSNVKGYSVDSVKTFRLSMYGYAKTIILLWFMSVCVIGNYGILIYTFVKGFSYGAVFCALISALEIKSVLFFLCAILLHTAISLPCITSYMLFCFKNSCMIFNGGKKLKKRTLFSFGLALFTTVLLCIPALIQAYLEPFLIRISTL